MRARQLAFVALITGVLMALGTSAQAEILGVDFDPGGFYRVDYWADDVTGFRFQVGDDPLSVTDLGFWDEGADGLAEAHDVGIYRWSTQELVVSAEIPAGTDAALGGNWNSFRFVPVTPTVLMANTTYNLLVYRTTDSDGVAYQAVGSDLTPSIDFVTAVYGNDTGGLVFADTVADWFNPDEGFFGPNFKADIVPEPSSFALLGLGLLGICGWLWRRRR